MSEMTRTEKLLALAEDAGRYFGQRMTVNSSDIKQLVELALLQHEALDKHSVPCLGCADKYNEAIAAFSKFEGGE